MTARGRSEGSKLTQFQPGNTASVGLGRRGPAAETRKQNRLLAMAIRERINIEAVLDVLHAIAIEGVDPLTREAVPVAERMSAINVILDRGWGKPAQLVDVDAQVRAHVALLEQRAEPADAMSELSDTQLAALEALGIDPTAVIDADEDP